jgi:hypothetical protein
VQAQQDSDRENPPGNTAEQLLNKGRAKSDQLEILEQHKAVDASKQEEMVALKAQVETFKKAVNKFKRTIRKAETSLLPSPLTLPTKATALLQRRRKRGSPERIGRRSSTRNLNPPTQASLSSLLE